MNIYIYICIERERCALCLFMVRLPALGSRRRVGGRHSKHVLAKHVLLNMVLLNMF